MHTVLLTTPPYCDSEFASNILDVIHQRKHTTNTHRTIYVSLTRANRVQQLARVKRNMCPVFAGSTRADPRMHANDGAPPSNVGLRLPLCHTPFINEVDML